MPATKTQRTITIETPLGPDGLLFRRMTGHEALGRLYTFEIELLSAEEGIDFGRVVGQPVNVCVDQGNGGPRYLGGVVSRFADAGPLGRYTLYHATVRPRLWLLTRKADCRIYQQLSVPDVVKKLLREHGLTTFSDSLSGSYRKREYCVQYRETDFDFISRLMEEEGIYYFFKHDKSEQTLVLADSPIAHNPVPGYEEVPYHPGADGLADEREEIGSWTAAEEIASGAYFLQDFDFERPKANLQVKSVSQNRLAQKSLEIFDYPGGYTKTEDGEAYARLRLEELYAQQALVSAGGGVRGLGPGCTFKLTNHPRADQNREYLVISATYELRAGTYETAGAPEGPGFQCTFRAMDSQRPFRPARTTHKPTVKGPQTAVVVGKQNEEIWTDEHGRVRLQFHWDRLGELNESSSCWVRVAQTWAGNRWGGIHIPRVGQEVLVEFLEGDPDRPVVTGCLYNGNNKPPYTLPANQTQSGFKTRSSKGGNEGNFNEIRFEDKKGKEQIFVHAEKDHTIEVKNDETILVEGNRSEEVKKDESITISGKMTQSIGKDLKITISGKCDQKISKDLSLKVDGKRKQVIGSSDQLEVGTKLVVKAPSQIVLQSGSTKIEITPAGVVVKGTAVTVKASGALKLEATGMVNVKGAAVKLS
jgi:type VI secretion system secreted protein VgrG